MNRIKETLYIENFDPLNYSQKEDSTSIYQISMEGHLDESWSLELAGMQVENYAFEKTSMSVLTGKLKDQSELGGVLNTLINHRYKILTVLIFQNIGSYW